MAALVSIALSAPALAGDVARFGSPLAGGKPSDLAAVLAKPVDGQKVRLEGKVAAACQNKGCWLELEQDGKRVHVTFKDYAFFVPTDCAGKKVVLEGVVAVQQPDKDAVEHLQSEGASEAAASPVSVVATGVELR